MKMYRSDETPDPSRIIFKKHGKLAEVYRRETDRAEENMPPVEGRTTTGGFAIT